MFKFDRHGCGAGCAENHSYEEIQL
jgi:hypothetical protein